MLLTTIPTLSTTSSTFSTNLRTPKMETSSWENPSTLETVLTKDSDAWEDQETAHHNSLTSIKFNFKTLISSATSLRAPAKPVKLLDKFPILTTKLLQSPDKSGELLTQILTIHTEKAILIWDLKCPKMLLVMLVWLMICPCK